MTLVSVVTPVSRANHGFLAKAVRSVGMQGLGGNDLEWVVVVPKEELPTVAEVAAASETRTHLIETPVQLSAAEARTVALALAEGQWICPLDSDDYLPDLALTDLLRAVSENDGARWAIGDGLTLGASGAFTLWRAGLEPGRIPAGQLARVTRQTGAMPSIPNAGLYDADLLRALGGWPPLSRDEDSMVKLVVTSVAPGAYEPKPTYVYRRGVQGQATSTPSFSAMQTLSRTVIAGRMNSMAKLGHIDSDLSGGWETFIAAEPVA